MFRPNLFKSSRNVSEKKELTMEEFPVLVPSKVAAKVSTDYKQATEFPAIAPPPKKEMGILRISSSEGEIVHDHSGYSDEYLFKKQEEESIHYQMSQSVLKILRRREEYRLKMIRDYDEEEWHKISYESYIVPSSDDEAEEETEIIE